MTLMKLQKQAENKWNLESQRMQFQLQEEENKELRAKIAVGEHVQRRLVCEEEESAQETEDLERPRKRRRRNSDSGLYCKARDEDTAQSERELVMEAKYLESEKYEFVQRYLQNIQETRSITTETTDSGIRTHGEPSDLEMQDISDHSFQSICLKHLGKDVIRELNSRLAGDQVAVRQIYKSFGIKGPFQRSMNIFELFPDTPMKLFKDVLEALQLYDLVDLLEKQRPVRSLRLALPLKEIGKLRKPTYPRPTTYHSDVAVLIITDKKSHHTEGIERFFKGLSSKSDVTVFEWKAPAATEFQRKKLKIQKKMKINKTAVSAVIERWIHNQGKFSLFAVFVTGVRYEFTKFEGEWCTIMQKLMKSLVSGIPDKVKFLVGSHIPISVPESSESLVVMVTHGEYLYLERLMLDIFDKRWQKLDLISMMEEFNRSVCKSVKLSITDRLSSRPRFKKEEDLADCA